MKNHKDIFTGHESFSLREGWIVKGIDAINRRGKNIFNGNELINTIDEMGIGANMVKSLKYWLEVYNIVDEELEIKLIVSEILKYDSYMQKDMTLWILHFLALNEKRDRKNIVWNIISYKNENMPFDKEQIVDLINLETVKNYSKKTIENSLTVYIKTYFYQEDKKRNDPENNLISPFVKLNYLNKDKNNENFYFRNIEYKEINKYLGYMILKSFCKINNSIEKIEAYNKFKCIIKMDSYNFEMHLKEMENENLISIDRAAGLNNINLILITDDLELIKKIYEGV